MLVSKLSGFAKFDLDTKITKTQFYHLIEESSQVEGKAEEAEGEAAEGEEGSPQVTKCFNQEMYDQISNAWNKALSPEASAPPFQGDLENPTYLRIIQGLRDFKPENYPEEAAAE